MKQNIKVAKQLVKLAKSLIAESATYYDEDSNDITQELNAADFITPDINNENEKLVKTLHNVYKKLLNVIKKKNLTMSIQDDLTKGMQKNTTST